jgi:tetratricopeptide (TPR) repeat protein
LSALGSALSGTQLRAGISVSIVLILAFVVTGFLSAWYKNTRQAHGRRHYQIGQALASTGNVQGAAEEYRKALLFMPDDADYRISLCIALVELGKLDEAESHLQELLEGDPTNGRVNVLLARVAERRNEPAQAIDYFERAVYGYWPREKLAARHAARWELVSLLEKQNRRTEVIGELLQLYANSGHDASEKAKIGFLLLQDGAVSDAQSVFQDLSKASPKYAEAFYGLGKSYFEQGDYIAARREFQHAAHLQPSNRQNTEQLALVNAIIDVDPFQPRINAAERLGKSKALLDRVIRDLNSCGAGESPDLDRAKKLESAQRSDPDQLSDQLQSSAAGLWKSRNVQCAGGAKSDPVIDAVLARMTQ